MKGFTKFKLLVVIMCIYLLIIRIVDTNYGDFWNLESILRLAMPLLIILLFGFSIKFDLRKLKEDKSND